MHVSLSTRVAGAQRLGDREEQEDNFLVHDFGGEGQEADSVLLLLADGMGGHVGGAQASHLALRAFTEQFALPEAAEDTADRLSTALLFANQCLIDRVKADPALRGMGCTLIAAVVRADRVYWVSVGDSLLYLFRNGALTRLNADHSMVPILEKLVAAGELSARQAQVDPRRHQLRSAMGGTVPELIDVNSKGYPLQEGDTLLLASDGIESIPERKIARILERKRVRPIQDRIDELLDLAVRRGGSGQDNTTVILLDTFPSRETVARSEERTRRIATDRPAATRSAPAPSMPGLRLRVRWPLVAGLAALLAIVLLSIAWAWLQWQPRAVAVLQADRPGAAAIGRLAPRGDGARDELRGSLSS